MVILQTFVLAVCHMNTAVFTYTSTRPKCTSTVYMSCALDEKVDAFFDGSRTCQSICMQQRCVLAHGPI